MIEAATLFVFAYLLAHSTSGVPITGSAYRLVLLHEPVLVWCSSNFNVDENHLEILLQYRFCFCGSGGGCEPFISNELPHEDTAGPKTQISLWRKNLVDKPRIIE